LRSEKKELEEARKFYSKLEGIDTDLKKLEDSKKLDFRILQFEESKFRDRYGFGDFEILDGDEVSVLVFMKKRSDTVKTALNGIVSEEFNRDLESGKPSEIISSIDDRIQDIEQDISSEKEEIDQLADKWGQKLNYVENYLTEKIEKAEAPLNFGITDRAFIVKGWIPEEKREDLENQLETATDSSIHIEEEETGEHEEPPVKYSNNRVVQPFESLTELISRPKYGELDPSVLIWLTFPAFFGFMIGDAGYGLTSGIVFFLGMKKFPQASKMFKALMWTSAWTIVFGLIYGEIFGFHALHTPFYRGDMWQQIFYLTIGIGAVHVNLGILIGAYNEYIRHGLLEAVFAKGSWFLLQIAVVAGYLTSTSYGTTPGALVGLGIGLPTLIMLYKGEGIEGIVEIPSLLSNILSYARLFGVSIAAYALAGTVNSLAKPALASGSLMGLAAGTLIMVIGHTMMTFLKIMEGFLQGIRLHYVEQFGWFYEGGGRIYNPFGGKNQ
jgi:V/A-type H+-transporting ATPase subunit I